MDPAALWFYLFVFGVPSAFVLGHLWTKQEYERDPLEPHQRELVRHAIEQQRLREEAQRDQ